MALFRSENNSAGHEVSGLVSKQENLGQAGESYTQMRCERVSPLPGPESPRSVLHKFLHSSLHQREGAGGPEFTQVCAT